MNDMFVKRASLLASLCLAAGVAVAQPAPVGARAAGAPASSVRPVDSIVAVVNDSVITRKELDTRIEEAKHQLTLAKRPIPDADMLQRQVLEQMIVTQVQLQRAKEDGIVVKDADVEQALQRIAADNRLSVDQYKARLSQAGVPWDAFRKEVREQIIMARLRDREVDSQIQVSDSEINTFLAAQRGASATPSEPEYRLSEIIVKLPEGATPDQVSAAQKKATEALDKAKAGGDFAALAKEYSDASDAANGGDMGFRIPERIPDLYLTQIQKLQPGTVVPQVLRSNNGFHVIKLVETRKQGGEQGMTVPQIHARHILIRVGDGVSEAQARQKLLDIKAQIEAGKGDFADFARQYSVDGSASQGGDLGWISPGETVPAFERAMSELKDGQISDPVRSEYGYHLIQVLGHRESQVSGDQERNLAMQELRGRKAEQQYRDWLQQLRDSAYVDYRLNNAQQ
ncbi:MULTISPECIES: peptidylprolyl isomerase [Pandoraea]|jgi:peptidyl-prolyl cis-trans isomerase SurA|uniref:Chaperone SurA n=1 Tax=Pandoraea pnomenusa TaxID=93220 RepID=A0A378YMR1_9BURK|nr:MULTISPECIES: peptidylprolyl isomerase [Pandoraea]MBN9093356.1 peptidylprolyl isomerase [Pandoraea pnomenusa]QDH61402.1 molecular chaperone SurA [Pandoraea pnomenusa]QDX23380.1 molecular chaperone SurA [Pandoraea pnomenusa]SUA77797.1 Peptidyl-prolyl cis-trans isomerase surA [Pandoraea pnomenusa]